MPGVVSYKMKKEYLIIIEKAGNNYSAYSPDFTGVIATGKTVEATRETIKEAIRFHIDGLKMHNLPVPESTTISEYISL